MVMSCSSSVRKAEKAPAAVRDESVAADKQEQDAVQSYLGFIFQSLEEVKRYPSIAAQSGLSGRVVLRFTVRWDGEVVDPQITKVSGHESFGDAALQALREVGQLPPFPDEIRQREILVEVTITYQENGARERFYEWVVGEVKAAMEQGSTLIFFAVSQRLNAKIRSLAEEGNVHAQAFHAALQRNYSELGAELGIDADTLEMLLALSSDKQQTETWYCFKLFDRNKATAPVTLFRMRIGGKDFMGEVLVAGTAHIAQFQVAGLNRRWDWGCDEKTGCRYAFSVRPDDTGAFYDFSVSDDGRAKPSQVFECQLSP